MARTAISEDKAEIEGAWGKSHILLGFEVDVGELTIRAPKAKIVDARHTFHDPMMNQGNMIITVRAIQELRGLINRWSYASRFWYYVDPPVNGLMSPADATDTWIRRISAQVWIAFWNLMASIRAMGGGGGENRENIFRGQLEQIIPISKRVGR